MSDDVFSFDTHHEGKTQVDSTNGSGISNIDNCEGKYKHWHVGKL